MSPTPQLLLQVPQNMCPYKLSPYGGCAEEVLSITPWGQEQILSNLLFLERNPPLLPFWAIPTTGLCLNSMALA